MKHKDYHFTDKNCQNIVLILPDFHPKTAKKDTFVACLIISTVKLPGSLPPK
jgi:hypothetical protein